jgi:hypothetical protein
VSTAAWGPASIESVPALAFGVDGLVNVVRPVFDVREDLQVRKLRELPYLGAMFGVGLVIVLR